MNLFQIYEGWKNKLIPAADMKDRIEAVSEMRMAICKTCPDFSENKKEGMHKLRPDLHCTRCGCTLSAKTRCLSCSCPMDKWKALMEDEQFDEILSELKTYE